VALSIGAVVARAGGADELPKGERAAIATADGLTLVGTWWAAGEPKGPAVVVLPGEGEDRERATTSRSAFGAAR
jgi:hypothetical protein